MSNSVHMHAYTYQVPRILKEHVHAAYVCALCAIPTLTCRCTSEAEGSWGKLRHQRRFGWSSFRSPGSTLSTGFHVIWCEARHLLHQSSRKPTSSEDSIPLFVVSKASKDGDDMQICTRNSNYGFRTITQSEVRPWTLAWQAQGNHRLGMPSAM